jgi:hypothetical protein
MHLQSLAHTTSGVFSVSLTFSRSTTEYELLLRLSRATIHALPRHPPTRQAKYTDTQPNNEEKFHSMRFLSCLFFHFFILLHVGVIGDMSNVFFRGVVQGSQLRRFISSAIHAQMSSTQGNVYPFPQAKDR